MILHHRPVVPRRRLGLVDLAVAAFVFAVLYAFLRLGADMTASVSSLQQPPIELDPARLPYYAGRSLLRMFLAFGASVLFALVYGYVAAKNRTAEAILIPLADILQSVPYWGSCRRR